MAWEYNTLDRILIVDLHKLLVPDNDDGEEQMSNILTHVHLGVVDHLIIHAYVESCTRDAYDGRSMTLYHPIEIGCFPELDDLVHNPPLRVHVTCRLLGDVNDICQRKEFMTIMLVLFDTILAYMGLIEKTMYVSSNKFNNKWF
jgi:hypothetical protein